MLLQTEIERTFHVEKPLISLEISGFFFAIC